MVVCAYNEEKTLTPTVLRLGKILPIFFSQYQIIIVDDGSTDLTQVIFMKLQGTHHFIQVIRLVGNCGLGSALMAGLSISSGSYFMEVHAKNDLHASDLFKIFFSVDGCKMVIPLQNNIKEREWHGQILSIAYVRMVNWLSGTSVPYYNDYVVYPLNELKKISVVSKGHTIGAELVVKMIYRGVSYVQVPVNDQSYRQSKSRSLTLGNLWQAFRLMIELLKLRTRQALL